jgi:hypothetical protein
MAEVNQKRIDKARQIIQKAFDEVADVYPEMAIIAYKEGKFAENNGFVPTLLTRGKVEFSQMVFAAMLRRKRNTKELRDADFVAVANQVTEELFKVYREEMKTLVPVWEVVCIDPMYDHMRRGFIAAGIAACNMMLSMERVLQKEA